MTGLAAALAAGAALFLVLAGGAPPRLALGRARWRRLAARSLGLTVRSAWEETLWRWLLLGRLATAVGSVPALAVTAVCFGLCHRRRQGWHGASIHVFTGAVFGAVYLACGGLLAAFAAHALFNILVAAAIELGR